MISVMKVAFSACMVLIDLSAVCSLSGLQTSSMLTRMGRVGLNHGPLKSPIVDEFPTLKATLIPSLATCTSRMTRGERRLAERLERKLDADSVVWYDVAVGPLSQHPDFVLLHPRNGLLILEVKDIQLSTLIEANKETWTIRGEVGPKKIRNPLEQARQYAHQVVQALEQDAELVQPTGPHQGKLAGPWSYGVVLPYITRAQFENSGLHQIIEHHRVLCQDEMLERINNEEFQHRLLKMFPYKFGHALSQKQIDRVRWILFPDVRVHQWYRQGKSLVRASSNLNEVTVASSKSQEHKRSILPSRMRVMDMRQEQLARSLGDGHRVIHGVAGSGKTMLLAYRATHLAEKLSLQDSDAKPILVLCYNEPLAKHLANLMQDRGVSDRVQTVHFHKWCREQLVKFNCPLPNKNLPVGEMMADMVQRVIHGVEQKRIPTGQYCAILVDEAHDFESEWLRLSAQMVDPVTNSLLILYDDAQSIYERSLDRKFSFKSVGIKAQGRTTILKINYRNTRKILRVASNIASSILIQKDSEDDGVPLLIPDSCGQEGDMPVVVCQPTLQQEATKVAELLTIIHRKGYTWGDMAILCLRRSDMDIYDRILESFSIPHQVRKGSGSLELCTDTVKVMTIHASKGLEFPVVGLVGMGHKTTLGEKRQARLFYVGATRAMEVLIIGTSSRSPFTRRSKTFQRRH